MFIQEEPPRPTDPFATFDDDYETAVLHLAWDLHTQTKELTLLFGLVELLPTEVPPPFEDDDETCLLRGKTNHRLFLRRMVMPAREALRWYLDCLRGISAIPYKQGDPPSSRLLLSEFQEEPPWPNLVCVSGDDETPPFCASWQENPRMHHLRPLSEPEIMQGWRDSERDKATDWLSELLHFRFDDYPEYWGSVHLVAPNPVFRDIDMCVRSATPPGSNLWMRFLPRTGKLVEGLQMTCCPNASSGSVDIRQFAVKSQFLRLESTTDVADVEYEVFDPKRGLLARGSYGFPTAFAAQMNMHTGRLHVPGKTEKESFEVDRMSNTGTIIVGETEKKPSARARMTEGQILRRRKRHVDTRSQRWFSGAKDEATSIVRELIHPAKREVLIVDPFFGPNELTFALAVRQEGIPIQILSSAKVLRGDYEYDGRVKEMGEVLLENLDLLAARVRLNGIEI